MDEPNHSYYGDYGGRNHDAMVNQYMIDGHHQTEYHQGDDENNGPSGYVSGHYQTSHEDHLNHDSIMNESSPEAYGYNEESYDRTTSEKGEDQSKKNRKVGTNSNAAASFSFREKDGSYFHKNSHVEGRVHDKEMTDPSNDRNHIRDDTMVAPEDEEDHQPMTKKTTFAASLRETAIRDINQAAMNRHDKSRENPADFDDNFNDSNIFRVHHPYQEEYGNARSLQEEESDESPAATLGSIEKMTLLENLATLVEEKERNLNGLMAKLVEDFTKYIHVYDENMKIYNQIHSNVQQEAQRLDRCEEEVHQTISGMNLTQAEGLSVFSHPSVRNQRQN